MLGHMKLSIGQIRSAVLACDEALLSEQHLRQMETFAPSKPEVCIRVKSTVGAAISPPPPPHTRTHHETSHKALICPLYQFVICWDVVL